MSKSKSFISSLIFTLTLVFSPFVLGGANAQSSCKGQAKSACSSSSKCAWVNAFTRSDGAKVKAHCRKKPNGSSSSSSSSSSSNKKKDTKKKDNKKKAEKKKSS